MILGTIAGDEEGSFVMDRAPTAEEAETIRRYLGLAKRPELSAEHVALLRARAKRLADERVKNPPSREEPASPP